MKSIEINEAEPVKSIEINESGDKNKNDLGVNNSMNEVIMTSTVVGLPLSNKGWNEEIFTNHEEVITQAENTRSKTRVQSVPQDLHTANIHL